MFFERRCSIEGGNCKLHLQIADFSFAHVQVSLCISPQNCVSAGMFVRRETSRELDEMKRRLQRKRKNDREELLWL